MFPTVREDVLAPKAKGLTITIFRTPIGFRSEHGFSVGKAVRFFNIRPDAPGVFGN